MGVAIANTVFAPFSKVSRKPNGFNWPSTLPEVRAYKSGNSYDCNIKPEDLIDPDLYTGRVYVNVNAANDSGNGLTWATAKQKISSGKTVANSLGVPTKILVAAGTYVRTLSFVGAAVTPTVPMMFEAVGGRVVTGSFEALTWTLVAGKTYAYQATRSNVTECYNPVRLNADGLYTQYTWVASIDLVDTTEGSWFTDNVTVYCHPHGNSLASDRVVRAYLTSQYANVWNANYDMLMRGFDMEGGNVCIYVSVGTTNTVVVDNCTARYAAVSNIHTGGSTYANGCSVVGGCKLFAAFNSDFSKNSQDGLNVHLSGAQIPSVLAVNCTGQKNGDGASTSNNGLTVHEGVKLIAIGGKYEYSYGSNVACINDDTQAWCVGVTAGGSLGDIPLGGSVNYGGFAMISGDAQMWLDSCIDWGCDIGVYAGASSTVYLHEHTGSGSRSGAGTISNY